MTDDREEFLSALGMDEAETRRCCLRAYLPLLRQSLDDRLALTKHFVSVIEESIADEKQEFLAGIEEETLSESNQWTLWYWEQASRGLRVSAFLSLYSVVEVNLKSVTRLLEDSNRSGRVPVPERCKDALRGADIVARPTEEDWKTLDRIRIIRNSLVHADGDLTEEPPDRAKHISDAAAELPGIVVRSDQLEIDDQLLPHILGFARRFFSELHDETTAIFGL